MTQKQDQAITNMAENGGNVSRAMIKAGYSAATAKTPGKLTKSKGFKDKLSNLAKIHNVTLDQYMVNIGLAMTADKMNQFTGEIVPDISARLSGNKMAERFIFKEPETAPPNNTQLTEALNDNKVDEIQLMRVLKNQN